MSNVNRVSSSQILRTSGCWSTWRAWRSRRCTLRLPTRATRRLTDSTFHTSSGERERQRILIMLLFTYLLISIYCQHLLFYLYLWVFILFIIIILLLFCLLYLFFIFFLFLILSILFFFFFSVLVLSILCFPRCSVIILAPVSLYLEEAFEVLHFPNAMRYDFYAGCLLSGILGLFLNLSSMKVFVIIPPEPINTCTVSFYLCLAPTRSP